jgi:hypothetical protein
MTGAKIPRETEWLAAAMPESQCARADMSQIDVTTEFKHRQQLESAATALCELSTAFGAPLILFRLSLQMRQ